MLGWTDLGFGDNCAPTISLLAKATPRHFLVSSQGAPLTPASLSLPTTASSAGCPYSSQSSTTPTSHPLEAWTPAVSAPASAPPPAPVTDMCHPPSELWSRACKGGRPGAGASPMTEPHRAEESAVGTLLAVAAEKLGATAGLAGLLEWLSGGQDGGHLAPDLAPYL